MLENAPRLLDGLLSGLQQGGVVVVPGLFGLPSGLESVLDMGLAGVLTSPIGTTNYSYSATIGVFRSVVSLILVMGSNAIAKAAGEDGVY